VKIVLTGSSGGIGQWLVMHLCKAGHEIWGISRRDQSDQGIRKKGNYGNFRSSICDVGDWNQIQDLGSAISGDWGKIDAVICCAGSQMPIGTAMSQDPGEWSKNISQNLNGTFFTIRSLHRLLDRGTQRAKVICFSGGGATSPRENFSAYACSKTAIIRLVENLSLEWSGERIDINALAPGAIYTAMTEEVIGLGPETAGKKEYQQALEQKQSGGASLEKVGAMVDFMLASESDGISGKLLSAPWDSIEYLSANREALIQNDIFTLRRVLPSGGASGAK
jgi:NAD(P)-dependent dehydrogenase (short-subunit alcohol dehydrogenase family)